MDEYNSNLRGMELKSFADRVAAANVLHEYNTLSRCTRVSVEGYDTSLHPDAIRAALMDHFRSCGQICDVDIPTDLKTHAVIDRVGFIYFREEGAQEKAVALSGSDVGGWNVIVKALPKKVCDPSGFLVTGYDTSLDEDYVKSALFEHFRSCGEIVYVSIEREYRQPSLLSRYGFISILGDGALEKALGLSGSDLGGWKDQHSEVLRAGSSTFQAYILRAEIPYLTSSNSFTSKEQASSQLDHSA
ncbi:unnamed protein product [Arabis nemorensis]|uniref:RRM domain-containing protein n=1 Tax=Arabis nemorensis TaxID=586526 RepID=A0A565BWR8_9BRAS|nr:unnamed protein product [Arabis nemorensis]